MSQDKEVTMEMLKYAIKCAEDENMLPIAIKLDKGLLFKEDLQ